MAWMVGLGLIQYTQDYDEKLPRAWYGDGPSPSNANSYKWMDAIRPYVKSTQVYTCPSASSILASGVTGNYIPYDTVSATAPVNPGYGDQNYGSYAMNSVYWGNGLSQQGPGNGGMSLANLNAPATTIWLGDGNGSYQVAWQNAAANQPVRGSGGQRWLGIDLNNRQEGTWSERHLETANFLCTDGHVKSIKLDKVVAPLSNDGGGFYSSLTPADD